MKKIGILIFVVMCFFVGCKQNNLYNQVIEELITDGIITTTDYTYTIKEIEHNEVPKGDDEIYCFDISITQENVTKRYCCFVIVSDGEIMYVDCDLWVE